ncbi:MAG: universal stress protein [Haloarculaceae archaeon]
MPMRVLVPMDHSPLAGRALEEALESHPDAEISVLHVIDYVEQAGAAQLLLGSEELEARAEERTDVLFERAREIAADYNSEIETTRRVGEPSREILRYVETHNLDRIVVGSHGRSAVGRFILGSVAEYVLRHSPVPVTVVR